MKKLKEIIRLILEIPGDLCRKEFYVGLLGFMIVLFKAWIIIVVFCLLVGNISRLGHGDAEYQKTYSQIYSGD